MAQRGKLSFLRGPTYRDADHTDDPCQGVAELVKLELERRLLGILLRLLAQVRLMKQQGAASNNIVTYVSEDERVGTPEAPRAK